MNNSISKSATLRNISDQAGFSIGSCVDVNALSSDPKYAKLLAQEFNTLVAENVFKPGNVWKGPEEYDFSEADRLAKFALDNKMTIRGHTLVWHQSVPQWLVSSGLTAGQVQDLLRKYIYAIVGRYRGVITCWDVVNEAVTDGPDSDWRTSSFWYETLGPEYLANAFIWAHEADPNARLYYNDYETEGMDAKSNRVYRLIRELFNADVPIHGVGLQGHLLNGWRASDENRENIRRIVALGLDWQFTEVDIRIIMNGAAPTDAQLRDQALAYGDLIDLCITEPGCKGFLTWGFTDKYSWVPGFRPGQGAALLFDEHFEPKPAYNAIKERLIRNSLRFQTQPDVRQPVPTPRSVGALDHGMA